MNIFKNLFRKKKPPAIKDIPKKSTILDLSQFDDVCIKIDNDIYDG